MIKSRDWRKTPETGSGGRCGEGPKQMRTRGGQQESDGDQYGEVCSAEEE